MRMKFQLLTTTCRRCGKSIVTGNRSLFGADAAKARLDRICEACITPDELAEIRGEQRKAVELNIAKGD